MGKFAEGRWYLIGGGLWWCGWMPECNRRVNGLPSLSDFGPDELRLGAEVCLNEYEAALRPAGLDSGRSLARAFVVGMSLMPALSRLYRW